MESPGFQGSVTFIAGTLGRGGAERQLYYMLQALAQSAGLSRVELLCLTQGEAWETPIQELGVPVRYVGRHPSRLMRLAAVIKQVRRSRPVIIQSQHFFTNLYAAVAARLCGGREIGAIRSDGRSELRANKGLLGRLQLRLPRLLAANSRTAIAYLRGIGVPEKHLHFLPNVVDVTRFRVREHGDGSRTCIVSVGRLAPEKRLDRFLRVLAKAIDSDEGVTGEIVGSGPEEGRLRAISQREGLSSRDLVFRGDVSDPALIYQNADILLHTSDWEGTPNVILEAMASGIPVVATRVGGIPDLVQEGVTGFLVEPDDLAGMENAVRTLVGRPDLRRQMGKAGRSYIESRHSREVLPHALDKLHRRALNGKQVRERE